MPQLIKNRVLAEDRWTLVREADAAMPAGPAIVPLATWKALRNALLARGDVGVWLAPADDPAELADDLPRIPLVAVDFPQFADGRGYSTARLLRQRHGFGGELRAIGDIQRDQLAYLAQCGFDAFAIRDGKDARDALAGLNDFSDGYQLTEGRLPWFRRRAYAAAVAGSRAVVE
ncbi:MAG TPA: DUF934 domain-containing protein [Casimicrobiaceae bacterium]